MKHSHLSAFQLGDTVREKISGIEGRVIGINFWETTCTHIGVKRLGVNAEGKPHDLLWFDEPMLDLVAPAKPDQLAPNAAPKPGGPLASGLSHARGGHRG